MFPIPSSEKLIETKTCTHCSASFPITDKDLEFYNKVSPVFAWKKYSIPAPTFCPNCRQQRRLSFRNERKLYKRKCDATGKDIISIYSPDKINKVYHQDFWWSDKWDPMDYGRDFDFSKNAMEQFSELQKEVPEMNILSKMNENCEYVSSVGNSHNCYLISDSDFCEDSMYSAIMKKSKNIVDGLHIYMCENTYNSINCTDSFNLINCFECNGSQFLFGCARLTNCSYCYDSSNLINKKYVIKNKQVTELEWQEFIKSAPMPSLRDFWIARNRYIIESENIIGNNIYKSNNILTSYNIGECENIRYSTLLNWSKNCGDVDAFGINLSRGYECISIGSESDFICFGDIITSNCRDIFYSHCMSWSQNCFLCSGLRNKSYCILNKQYTKEEYEELVPRIIEHMTKTGEWGEFFPSSISPFGYNETVASEYFPLSREEILGNSSFVKELSETKRKTEDLVSETKSPALQAPSLQRGLQFNWSDYEAPFPRVEKIIKASMLSDDISKIPDDILNWAIECEVSGKPFRIIPQELEFYRKHHISIPHRHPDQRHLDRMSLRNPRKLFERRCDCCKKDIITTYSPERPETVYCEGCYNKEIY